MPHRPPGMGAGMMLALFAHALLVVALAFGVSWRSSVPDSVEAELWAAVPQIAAPLPPPPPPPEPKPVEIKPPAPAPKPVPVQQAAPDAQIAIEKARREALKLEEARREEAKREEAKREEAKREAAKREEAKREAAKRELARAEAERKKKELAEKEEAEAEEQRLETQRQANLKRILGQAGAAPNANAAGTAAQSAGPSAAYAGRIKARIKPNIVLTEPLSGDPVATVEVRLAPDGTIVARKLVKSSGAKAWDEAVLRAIDKTEILPRDVDGRVPPLIEIDFKPRD
ncbi:MAG: cell envelope integrity protein TolA [Burkholderiaceae bacterium]